MLPLTTKFGAYLGGIETPVISTGLGPVLVRFGAYLGGIETRAVHLERARNTHVWSLPRRD